MKLPQYNEGNVSSYSEKCKMEQAAYINTGLLRFQPGLHRTGHSARPRPPLIFM